MRVMVRRFKAAQDEAAAERPVLAGEVEAIVRDVMARELEAMVRAEVATYAKQSMSRGEQARATRFANDVDEACDWYLGSGKNRANRAAVLAKVEWLKKRAKQAGRTR